MAHELETAHDMIESSCLTNRDIICRLTYPGPGYTRARAAASSVLLLSLMHLPSSDIYIASTRVAICLFVGSADVAGAV